MDMEGGRVDVEGGWCMWRANGGLGGRVDVEGEWWMWRERGEGGGMSQ